MPLTSLDFVGRGPQTQRVNLLAENHYRFSACREDQARCDHLLNFWLTYYTIREVLESYSSVAQPELFIPSGDRNPAAEIQPNEVPTLRGP